MPRIARIVIPHYPHHVTQRGNRRQKVFFNDEDYIFYKEKITAALSQMQIVWRVSSSWRSNTVIWTSIVWV